MCTNVWILYGGGIHLDGVALKLACFCVSLLAVAIRAVRFIG